MKKVAHMQKDKKQDLVLNFRPPNNEFDFESMHDKYENITCLSICGLYDGVQFKNVQSLSKYKNLNEIFVNTSTYMHLLDLVPRPEKIEKLTVAYCNGIECDFLIKYMNLKELDIKVLVTAVELINILSKINTSLEKLTLEFCRTAMSFDMKDFHVLKSIKELIIKPYFSSDKTVPPLHNCNFLKTLGINNISICEKPVDEYEIELDRNKVLAYKASSRAFSRINKIAKIKNKTSRYGGVSRCGLCGSIYDSTDNKCYRCNKMEFIKCVICSTQVKTIVLGQICTCPICSTKYKLLLPNANAKTKYEIKIGTVNTTVYQCSLCTSLYFCDLLECSLCNGNKENVIKCALCNVCCALPISLDGTRDVTESKYTCALCKTEHHIFEDGTYDIYDKFGRVIY